MSASDAALRALGGAVERLSMTVMSQQSGHLSNVDASSQHGHGTVKSLASSGEAGMAGTQP